MVETFSMQCPTVLELYNLLSSVVWGGVSSDGVSSAHTFVLGSCQHDLVCLYHLHCSLPPAAARASHVPHGRGY